MREIKFRGKRISDSRWVYGYYVFQFEVDPETIGQYTGLKDKNGKEIFEGDVLRYTKVGGHSSRGIVKYVTEFARWEYWHTQQKQGFPVLSDHDNMEIIGNIHDKPELIHDQKAEVEG